MGQNTKAVLKSLMKSRALKKEKKIDSPLVRYNDSGQPVCKVCNVAVKDEGFWMGHLASKGHKEGVENLKRLGAARKLAASQSASKVDEPAVAATEETVEISTTRKASALPEDFFDAPSSKSAKIETHVVEQPVSKNKALKEVEVVKTSAVEPPVEQSTKSSKLPEDFFEIKDGDKKGKGKMNKGKDLTEELKEFEKAVKEDLFVVEEQKEEEDEELAQDREEEEAYTQQVLLDRVEQLRRRRQEKEVALQQKTSLVETNSTANEMEAEDEEESDGEDDEDLLGVGMMNWRSRHV